jgi:NADH-quinone oxidoreductase subunit A
MHAVAEAVRFSPWEPGLLSMGLYALLVLTMVGILLF